MKAVFRDRHDRIDYLKAREEARRILADPGLLASARAFLERAMAPDPQQRDAVALWRAVLARPAPEVAALLVEDSPRGQYARETRPVFGRGLSSQDVARLLAAG